MIVLVLVVTSTGVDVVFVCEVGVRAALLVRLPSLTFKEEEEEEEVVEEDNEGLEEDDAWASEEPLVTGEGVATATATAVATAVADDAEEDNEGIDEDALCTRAKASDCGGVIATKNPNLS